MFKKIIPILCFLIISGCKKNLPCSVIDPSCNLVSSLFIENAFKSEVTNLTFSPSGGTYKYDQFVNILSNRSDMLIKYSLNSTAPSCSSNSGEVFKLPQLIQVSNSVATSAPSITLTAVACKNGQLLRTISSTYTIQYSLKPISGLQYWGSALSVSYTDGASVNFLPDLSGKGNHLIGASVISQNSSNDPTFISTNADMDGKPSIRFVKSKKQFLYKTGISNITNTTSGTYIVVLKKTIGFDSVSESMLNIGAFDASLGTGIREFRFSNNLGNFIFCSRGVTLNCGISATGSTSTYPLNVFKVAISTVSTNGDVTYNISEASVGTGGTLITGAFSSIERITIGGQANLSSNFLDGDIVEILYSNVNLGGTAEFSNLACYMNDKYKLNIPASPACP